MQRNISIVIPYYNRADLVMETLAYPLTDDRINEIIICDDCSTKEDIEKLLKNIEGLPKVRFVRNVVNHHNQHNKRNCISFSKNEWCLVFDNDNTFNKDFIDKLYSFKKWDIDTIYHPAFAAPHFDYRMFNNELITKENVHTFCVHDIFVTLCNTNNYFVNRDEYIRRYKHDKSIRGADGIFYAYNWLDSGNKIKIVENMEYFHRVHDGSEFLREEKSNMKLIYNWMDKLKNINL